MTDTPITADITGAMNSQPATPTLTVQHTLTPEERYAVENAIARDYSAGPNPRGVYDVSGVPTLVTKTVEQVTLDRMAHAWDACAHEAHALEHLRSWQYAYLRERNPYRTTEPAQPEQPEHPGQAGPGGPGGDATAALARVLSVLDEWGMSTTDGGIVGDEDFAEAIQDNGAWRFARDLRDALTPSATSGASDD